MAIAKGRITSMDTAAARQAPGVHAIVTHENAGPLGKGSMNTAKLLGGPEVDHYHQAIAVVVAETFEQAPVQIDATYTTPDQTHAMMEPFASMAAWRGDEVVVWLSN